MSPSHAFTAEQSKRVMRGHGKEGYTPIQLTVSPETKDRLIALATRNGSWVMDEVREAIEKHLSEAGL